LQKQLKTCPSLERTIISAELDKLIILNVKLENQFRGKEVDTIYLRKLRESLGILENA